MSDIIAAMSTAAQSLSLAIGAGMLVSVVCDRLRFPALLPLLGVGLVLGVSGLGVVDGASLGRALGAIITVAIGLLIFEGTLHLNREELSHAPGAVRGLLTIGALVTWAGAAVLARVTLGFTIPGAILLGAALIVTGPTVVQPILRRMRVSPRLHTALGAEAVFIDPLGVVATVATLEMIRSYLATGSGSELWVHAAWAYLKPLVGGAAIGAIVGLGASYALRAGRERRVDPKRLNFFFLGTCMCAVGLGEVLAPEAGLGAVTVAGLILARVRLLGSTELRAFKEQLAAILVGTLFILLASRFRIGSLADVGLGEAAFVAGLVLLVRPVNVALATIGSRMTLREKAFAALFAPRGIVALAVASIAATELGRVGSDGVAGASGELALALAGDAARFELVMFLTIVTTVLLATVVSPVLARLLGVGAGQAGGLVLVGGHPLALATSTLLRGHNVPVRIVDTNAARIAAAQAAGIEAFLGDATDTRWLDDVVLTPDFGWVIAWTGNDTVDRVVARWGHERLGAGRAGVWSDGRTKADMAEAEIGGGRLLGETIDAVEGGRLVVTAEVPSASAGTVFGVITGTKFRLVHAGDGAPPARPAESLVVGVRVPFDAASREPDKK